ncbi:M23 family metallopeptidase [archaeon]|jgi:murein DD-endopeptidase MepM/ murein hydrolase activator NlpD|nr:M23 family metallopeptidase [archaeon]MBT3730599.1 M23 family metallopeptidase [archaeon]MBT4669501.1 M23 family metallopeptidase [archaeon]MBT5030258.1 M23 family metallopeptidase [archaeon]MBT5287643.1 M23 family metallopeptidase [archaeon]
MVTNKNNEHPATAFAKWLGTCAVDGVSATSRGLRSAGAYMSPRMVDGAKFLAPKIRDGVDKVGPYVLPNLAAIGIIHSGVEGIDNVANISGWLETGSFWTGMAALGVTNYEMLNGSLKEKVNDLASKWDSVPVNARSGILAGLTALMLVPEGPREAVTGGIGRIVDDISNIYQDNTLTEAEAIEKYAKFQAPSRNDGQDIVDNFDVNAPFGVYRAGGRRHQGIDDACSIGDNVYSPGVGRVRGHIDDNLNGYGIRIKLADGKEATLIHLNDDSDLEAGDLVSLDTVVGECGCSGNCIGRDGVISGNEYPHTHFQLKDGAGGNVINPTPYILGDKDAELQAKMERSPEIYMPFLEQIAELDGYRIERINGDSGE